MVRRKRRLVSERIFPIGLPHGPLQAAPLRNCTIESRSGATKAEREAKMVKAERVLVVEDDAMIGMLLAEILEQMGHGVCAIETTEADAVTSAVRYRPDLVIVDERLREGSGVSAVEEMLRTRPVPHVFITGDASKVRALRPDAAVMQKPFREADLARAIKRVLDAAPTS
jgi:two-component system, response regulator PdtaR